MIVKSSSEQFCAFLLVQDVEISAETYPLDSAPSGGKVGKVDKDWFVENSHAVCPSLASLTGKLALIKFIFCRHTGDGEKHSFIRCEHIGEA